MATVPSPAKLTSVKSSTQRTPLRTLQDQGSTGISRLNKPADYLNAMRLSALVFACIHIRASTLAKYQMRALTPDNDEVFGANIATSNRKHPLYRLLQRPNPHQNRYEFLYTIQMYLDLLGNCLVLLDGVDGLHGLPTSLWPLDPSRSRPLFDDNGLIGYGYMDANQQETLIPVDRVLHFQRPQPGNMYWGVGIAEVVAKEINIQAALTEYIAQFFNQGAQPSGLIVAPNALSDEQFLRFKMETLSVMAGGNNAHKLAVFDNDVTFQQLSATLKDLGATELDVMLMKKILTAFEVPGTKFGLLEFSSYKAEDMERSFTEAMESAAALVEGPLNRLAALYDKKGKPVSDAEIESVRRGTWFDGEPKGLYLSIVIPSKEPIATSVSTANAITENAYLTDDEKRNASLNMLGTLLTAPSGAKSNTLTSPKPKRRNNAETATETGSGPTTNNDTTTATES